MGLFDEDAPPAVDTPAEAQVADAPAEDVEMVQLVCVDRETAAFTHHVGDRPYTVTRNPTSVPAGAADEILASAEACGVRVEKMEG